MGSSVDEARGRPHFATTQWSIVARAGGSATPEQHAALSSLCESYWYPLYVFVRRRGFQTSEAQDLTQAFFAELLEKKRLQLADQQRGRFRSFLLAALSNFLANDQRRARCLKRGGRAATFSLDFEFGERRFKDEPVYSKTAEKEFERRWAMTLLDRAIGRLCDEYLAAGKQELFESLKSRLGADGDAAAYASIATRLGMSESAVKVAAHRIRKRCRQLLRDEIAQTVAGDDDIDDELRALFAAVG